MTSSFDPDWDPLATLEEIIRHQEETSQHVVNISKAVGQLAELSNELNYRIARLERAIDQVNTLIYGNKPPE